MNYMAARTSIGMAMTEAASSSVELSLQENRRSPCGVSKHVEQHGLLQIKSLMTSRRTMSDTSCLPMISKQPSDRKRPADFAIFDDFQVSSGSVPMEEQRVERRFSPLSNCSTEAGACSFVQEESSSPSSFATFPRSPSSEDSDNDAASDMEADSNNTKENTIPAEPIAGSASVSSMSLVRRTRQPGSIPLLELQLALDEAATSAADATTDATEIEVESDAEDVEPHLWSEGLAEKLEERVRSNAEGMYVFDIYEDPMDL